MKLSINYKYIIIFIAFVSLTYGAYFYKDLFNSQGQWIPIYSTLIGIFIASTTTYIYHTIRKYDHDRSRRERTIELMQYWHQHHYRLNDPLLKPLHLYEALRYCSERICVEIENKREFTVSAPAVRSFKEICGSDLIADSETIGCFVVNRHQSEIIRSEFTRNANLLEIVAAAYMNHVADRQMIEQEFKHVLFDQNYFYLDEFIKATNRYPSLKAMRLTFQNDNTKQAAHEKLD